MKYLVVGTLLLASMSVLANEQQLDLRIEDAVLWRFVADNDSYELFYRYEYEWDKPHYQFDWGVALPLEQVQLTVGNVVASGALKLTEHLLGYGRNSSYSHTNGAVKLADGLVAPEQYGLYARFYPYEVPVAFVAGGTIDERVQKVVVGGTVTIQDELVIESWNTMTLLNPTDSQPVTEQSWFASEYDTNPHQFGNSSIHLLLDQPGLDAALHGVLQYGPWLSPQGSAALHLTAGVKPHYTSAKGGWGSPLLLDANGSLSKRLWYVDSGYQFIPSEYFKLAAEYQAIGYSNTERLQSISYGDVQWVNQYQLSVDTGLVIKIAEEQNTHSDSDQQLSELWLKPSGTINYKTDQRPNSAYDSRLTTDAEIELELLTSSISASLGAEYRWQWYDEDDIKKRMVCEVDISGDSLELTGSIRWEVEELLLFPQTATVKLAYSQSLVDWYVALDLTQFPLTNASFMDDVVIRAGFTVGW